MVVASSSYESAVLADAPTVYWRLDEADGTNMVDDSGNNHTGAYTASVEHCAQGAVDGATGTRFNGTNASGHASVDLSATSVITAEFWLNWSGTPGDDRVAAEFTDSSNYFYSSNGFYLSPDSAFDHDFEVSMGDGSGVRFSGGKFARPSAGAWHHYAIVMDRSSGAIKPYVDGVLQPFSYTVSGTSSTNFGNLTLWLLSHLGTGQFGQGTLGDFAIYPVPLTVTQIVAHYAARNSPTPTSASPAPAATQTINLTPHDPTLDPTSKELKNPQRGIWNWLLDEHAPASFQTNDIYMGFSWGRDANSLEDPRSPGSLSGATPIYNWGSIDDIVARARVGNGRVNLALANLDGGPPTAIANATGGLHRSAAVGLEPTWRNDLLWDEYQRLLTDVANHIVPDGLGHAVKDHPNVGYIIIMGYGNVGEWWSDGENDPPPTNAQVERIINASLSAFPNKIHALTLGADSDLAYQHARDWILRGTPGPNPHRRIGVYCATWGNGFDGSSTSMSLMQTTNLPAGTYEPGEVANTGAPMWQTAPIIGEWISAQYAGGASMPQTGDAEFAANHASMVAGNEGIISPGPDRSWPDPNRDPTNYRAMVHAAKELGYRYVLTQVTAPATVISGSSMQITHNWANVNVAPTYLNPRTRWLLKQAANTWTLGTSSLDLRTVRPDNHPLSSPLSLSETFNVPSLPSGTYTLAVRVDDQDDIGGALQLAITNTRDADGAYEIGTVTI